MTTETSKFPEGFRPSLLARQGRRVIVLIAQRIELGWVYWRSGCLEFTGRMPLDAWERVAKSQTEFEASV